MKKNKMQLMISGGLFGLFLIFTFCVKLLDVKAIGPKDSSVGFAGLNGFFYKTIGVNFTLYTITDWLSILPIVLALGYALLGLIQWIKRKKLIKVDGQILALGIFYILVGGFYLFFEFFVLNRRPVLIDDILEASYPSSTTMLVLCIMLTSVDLTNYLIKNELAKKTVMILSVLFAVFMVVGRILSGVHWITDILGGAILSASLICLYYGLKNTILLSQEKQANKEEPMEKEEI